MLSEAHASCIELPHECILLDFAHTGGLSGGMCIYCLFVAAQPGTAGIPLQQPTQSSITSQSPFRHSADPVLPWFLASDDPMQAYEAVDAGSAAWSPQVGRAVC